MAEKTLVALDGSAPAERALEYALEHLVDGSIGVVHVIDPWADVGETRLTPHDEEWIGKREAAAEELFEAARDTAGEYGVDLSTETRVGRPAREIIEHADDGGFDSIVVGTHGRTGARRVVMGSVAEQVVRRAPATVIVVR